ncbi:MAG: aspartyl-tRNA amidotransferase [Chloroflexi bacterium HGW-Chloroflexi-10]|nr:MAG: aspartyl-tRNA amidotransferase [Chloroflexi bacterium HGW-Chloroflexi-10]
MSLKEELSSSLINAMKEGNDDKKRTIRLVIANIKNNEIDKGHTLSDSEIISILHKEIKMRHETIEGASKNNRQDLIDEANREIAILNTYVPVGLSETEIRELVKSVIEEIGAKSQADMGKVMKVLLPKIDGQAPGNLVSQIVKEYLQF